MIGAERGRRIQIRTLPVVRALVGVLEATPAAHVVDEDGREVRLSRTDHVEQVFQGVASLDA